MNTTNPLLHQETAVSDTSPKASKKRKITEITQSPEVKETDNPVHMVTRHAKNKSPGTKTRKLNEIMSGCSINSGDKTQKNS
jgi:hypothetical protein